MAQREEHRHHADGGPGGGGGARHGAHRGGRGLQAGPHPVRPHLRLPEPDPDLADHPGHGATGQRRHGHQRPLRQDPALARQEAQAPDQGEEEEPQPALERVLSL